MVKVETFILKIGSNTQEVTDSLSNIYETREVLQLKVTPLTYKSVLYTIVYKDKFSSKWRRSYNDKINSHIFSEETLE